jgi:hypothetical protein
VLHVVNVFILSMNFMRIINVLPDLTNVDCLGRKTYKMERLNMIMLKHVERTKPSVGLKGYILNLMSNATRSWPCEPPGLRPEMGSVDGCVRLARLGSALRW